MFQKDFFSNKHTSRNQLICKDANSGIELWIKREDEIHPVISGNKFRKLKYNMLEALSRGEDKLLTFGGAFSNHIPAVAEAASIFDVKCIGVIRGDELQHKQSKLLQQNATLAFAHQKGMQFYFETRENYRLKHTTAQIEKYNNLFGKTYFIPEGGTNNLAIEGCKEIVVKEDANFDFICCSAGTGGTAAGIIEASLPHQKTIAFSALKGDFLSEEIKKWTTKSNWCLQTDFHFGGYAKVSNELIQFINQFYIQYKIPLDPVYTGKMLFGLFQLIKTGYFSENTRILAIHTGGLQAIESMNQKLNNKNSEIIQFN